TRSRLAGKVVRSVRLDDRLGLDNSGRFVRIVLANHSAVPGASGHADLVGGVGLARPPGLARSDSLLVAEPGRLDCLSALGVNGVGGSVFLWRGGSDSS